MFARAVAERFRALAEQWGLVILTGPRQSGKTTLARHTFPDAVYVNFENPAEQQRFEDDPEALLASLQGRAAILDEAQRVPDLFRWLQGFVDDQRGGPIVVTGSQQFLLSERIGQTLAGRAALVELLPLSLGELEGRATRRLDDLLGAPPAASGSPSLDEVMWRGLYPRVHDRGLDSGDFYAAYVRTYVERDVRTLLDVGDLDAFTRFLALVAGRAGQLVNLTSLGNDAGVSHKTVGRWLSVLRASYVLELVQPWHESFHKRVVKAPKIYFLDTGLLCWLLRIRNPTELEGHPLRGSVFENFVYSEIRKLQVQEGRPADIWFWRDGTGHEVDFVVPIGSRRLAVEVKAGRTLFPDAFRSLSWWCALAGEPGGVLVYGGTEPQRQHGHHAVPWGGITGG